MTAVEIPFHNPKTRILFYIGKNQTIGVGNIKELNRETGVNDVEKTERCVRELLKKADPRIDMTILKLTYRGSAMLQTFLPGSRRWYWKSLPIIGGFFIVFGIVNLTLLSSISGDFILGSFNGIIDLSLGAFQITYWWYSSIYGRRKLLEFDEKSVC
jgi:hypothetical protein